MKMGFETQKGKFIKNITVEKDFTNAIIYGRTGSGKTTGAILSIIEDRIKNNYGLLIYDFKGNLHSQVKYIANKANRLADIIEIGKPWGKNINILNYLTTKQFLKIVQSENEKSDYWDIASRNLLEGIYEILKLDRYILTQINKLQNSDYENEITIKEIHKQISKPTNLKNFLLLYKNFKLKFIDEEFLTIEYNEDIKLVNNIKLKINCLKEQLENLENYEKVDDGEDAGRNGVVSHLFSYTVNAASNDFLNKNETDIIEELRNGKIVIINVSNLNENILNLINLGIYSSLQRLNDKNLKPVSIIIDEAQKILHKDYLPETDVCRESRFEYIFATQSEILLINKLSEYKFKELISNIGTVYSFAGIDNDLEETHEYLYNNKNSYFAEPIFINDKELFEVEVKYQTENEIYKLIKATDKINFYLKFDAKLFEENKIYKIFEDGKKIEVDLYIQSLNLISVSTNKNFMEETKEQLKTIKLKNLDNNDMKKLNAIAYAISIIEDKFTANKKDFQEIIKEQNSVKELFLNTLKDINKLKKVS